MRDLGRVDLNLLVTLEALLAERNVTRAAERLSLSQPSVSVQLKKLRRIFADPLLLPGPRGMLPTARGLELLEPVRRALSGVAQLFESGSRFDPAGAKATWHIASSDYSEQAILLRVLLDIRKIAPGARVAVRPLVVPQVAKMAEMGAIDLAILQANAAPATLRRRMLFKDRYLLAVREGHRVLKQPLTLARFCGLDHMFISPDGGRFVGVTDALLEARRRKRHVSISVPHLLFAAELVRESDLVAMLPARLLGSAMRGLKVLEPPIEMPAIEIAMVWHERSHQDPAHRWLRDTVVAAAGESVG